VLGQSDDGKTVAFVFMETLFVIRFNPKIEKYHRYELELQSLSGELSGTDYDIEMVDISPQGLITLVSESKRLLVYKKIDAPLSRSPYSSFLSPLFARVGAPDISQLFLNTVILGDAGYMVSKLILPKIPYDDSNYELLGGFRNEMVTTRQNVFVNNLENQTCD
jgi:hypothetical protein